MNLIIEPRHKEEADRLILVLSISFAFLLEQNVYSPDEIADYANQYFPPLELRKLDSGIQDLFRSFTENRKPNTSFKKVYLDSLQTLKELPFWTDESKAWIFYYEETSGKDDSFTTFATLQFQGTIESTRIIYLICLGLAHALKNKAISVEDAETILFKPYLMDIFEGVDNDVVEIIDRGTCLEDADDFESISLESETQYILDRSLDKLKAMRI
jgi:hypothetical protein